MSFVPFFSCFPPVSGAFGAVLVGPVFHNWFRFLEKVVPRSDAVGVLGKTALDQIFMAPAFCTSFYTAVGLMEGKSFGEIKTKLQQDLVPTLQTNYKIWPFAQIFNFYVIPIHLRVLWINMYVPALIVVLCIRYSLLIDWSLYSSTPDFFVLLKRPTHV